MANETRQVPMTFENRLQKHEKDVMLRHMLMYFTIICILILDTSSIVTCKITVTQTHEENPNKVTLTANVSTVYTCQFMIATCVQQFWLFIYLTLKVSRQPIESASVSNESPDKVTLFYLSTVQLPLVMQCNTHKSRGQKNSTTYLPLKSESAMSLNSPLTTAVVFHWGAGLVS